jgi:hypothetical protein
MAARQIRHSAGSCLSVEMVPVPHLEQATAYAAGCSLIILRDMLLSLISCAASGHHGTLSGWHLRRGFFPHILLQRPPHVITLFELTFIIAGHITLVPAGIYFVAIGRRFIVCQK